MPAKNSQNKYRPSYAFLPSDETQRPEGTEVSPDIFIGIESVSASSSRCLLTATPWGSSWGALGSTGVPLPPVARAPLHFAGDLPPLGCPDLSPLLPLALPLAVLPLPFLSLPPLPPFTWGVHQGGVG